MFLLLFLVPLVTSEFAPLPPCTALSRDGFYFDWSGLNKTISFQWKNGFGGPQAYTSNICGLVNCCGADKCAFCYLGTSCSYTYCEGYDGYGYKPSWTAVNATTGQVSFSSYSSYGTLNLHCDHSVNASNPKIVGTDLFTGSYTSAAVCPIGQCPQACNYFSEYGSCDPKAKFTCSCNVGWTGAACDKSLYAQSQVSGNFSKGTIAGGAPVTIDIDLYTKEKEPMPCYRGGLPWNLSWVQFGQPNDCINGTRSILFESTKAGVHSLGISVFNKPIEGSPFQVIVSPSTLDPTKIVAAGSGLSRCVVHQKTSFSLTLEDRFGNELGICPPEIRNLSGALYGRTTQQVTFQCKDGVVTGLYTLDTSGDYQLTVRFNSDLLPGFPSAVKCSDKM